MESFSIRLSPDKVVRLALHFRHGPGDDLYPASRGLAISTAKEERIKQGKR